MGISFPNFRAMTSQPEIATATGIKVLCLRENTLSFEPSGDWPKLFSFPPRVGDFVQSSTGESKKIIEVVHFAMGDGSPGVVVRLGDDNTSSTPTEGGSTGDSF